MFRWTSDRSRGIYDGKENLYGNGALWIESESRVESLLRQEVFVPLVMPQINIVGWRKREKVRVVKNGFGWVISEEQTVEGGRKEADAYQ
jgi:hypothetical protein